MSGVPPPPRGPDNQPFSPQGRQALVPDITERDVFVCGPPAMTDAVLRSLRDLGVPARRRHAERFRLPAERCPPG
jgi:ferredoxin-NADP reductase